MSTKKSKNSQSQPQNSNHTPTIITVDEVNQNSNITNEFISIFDDLKTIKKIEPREFRPYLLGLIFFKYLSKKIEIFADEILAPDHLKYKKLVAKNHKKYLDEIKKISDSNNGYFINPDLLFEYILSSKRSNVLDAFSNAFKNIENSTLGKASEKNFKNLFDDVDFTSAILGKTVADKNELILYIADRINAIDFHMNSQDNPLLGDAFEDLISQFASDSNTDASKFYTPKAISQLISKIICSNRTQLRSIYDAAIGSASLVLQTKKDIRISKIYGQELGHSIYNLARMNIMIHNVGSLDFDVEQGNSLDHPKHINHKFEAIVSHPPFSDHWSRKPSFIQDPRFSDYGVLAPEKMADFAFIQHMFYHLEDNGIMAVVLPNGVLTREKPESIIRKYFVEHSLDAVIGLADKIFFGVSIDAYILIFKKNKSNNDVLFIDASKEYEKLGNRNTLSVENINKIFNAYQQRSNIQFFSKTVNVAIIAENQYKLNLLRYIDIEKTDRDINLKEIHNKLKNINSKIKDIDQKIADFCNQLSIDKPF